MKKILFTLVICTVFFCCKDQASSDTSSATTTSKEDTTPKANSIISEEINVNNYILKVDPIEKKEYVNLKNKDENRNIINKFCSESEGYQMNEWLGMNECGWAVEKYKIEQDKDFVNRKDNTLILKVKEGKDIQLKNVKPGDEDATYYRYRRMIASTFYVIEVIKNKTCPRYLLFNANTGKRTVLNGIPHFSKNNEYVFLSNFSNSNGKWCPNEILLYQVQNGEWKNQWAHKPANFIVVDAEWLDNETVYVSRMVKGEDLKVRKHAKINIAKK